MSEIVIGQWVARLSTSGVPRSKAHLIESIIADEPITRCGRRLRHIEGTVVEPRALLPISCSFCWGKP